MFETCSFGAPLSREVEAATVLDRSDISPLCSRSVLPEPDPEPPEPEHWRTEGRRGLRLLVTIIEVQEALLPLFGPEPWDESSYFSCDTDPPDFIWSPRIREMKAPVKSFLVSVIFDTVKFSAVLDFLGLLSMKTQLELPRTPLLGRAGVVTGAGSSSSLIVP